MSYTLYDILHVLGKKRSLEFLDSMKKSSQSYTGLQKSLNINSKLISSTIKELTLIGIIVKNKDKYELTKIGKKLLKKIKPLRKEFEIKKNKDKDIKKKKDKQPVMKTTIKKGNITSSTKNSKIVSVPAKKVITSKIVPKKLSSASKIATPKKGIIKKKASQPYTTTKKVTTKNIKK